MKTQNIVHDTILEESNYIKTKILKWEGTIFVYL